MYASNVTFKWKGIAVFYPKENIKLINTQTLHRLKVMIYVEEDGFYILIWFY